MARLQKIDKPFLIIVSIITFLGFFIFLSASLGLTAQDSTLLSSRLLNQLFFGLFFGSIGALITANINFVFWKKYSFWILLASIILTLLVFIPGLGMESGGAKRWLIIGKFSFQPAELLKIASVLYFAAWLSGVKKEVATIKLGLIPFLVLIGLTGILLLLQPDTDTFIVLCVALTSMYFVAGGKWKHIGVLFILGLVTFSMLVITRPYIRDRVMTFIDPSSNSLTSGYQIQQSLIAIGSGGLFGRGFGQSLQKFNFLPEPIGDSIFAVYAEEFGFIGSSILIMLYFLFLWRGLKIAANVQDQFGGLVVIGLVILVTTQAFMNISAMLGIIPLSGLPLIFVSHGGSALMTSLVAIGIIFNISKKSNI